MSERIPQANPLASYEAHRAEIDAAVAAVLRGGAYILGPQTAAFEQEFARYLGVEHVVAMASGTDAVHLALRAVGVGRDDLALTVSNTAVATVAGIEMSGASVALVEIDRETLTMDPAGVEDSLRRLPIRVIVPVHLYGYPAAMHAIMDLARSAGVPVVEDCAQAHGATIGDQKAGTFGNAAAFSFYPTKNLGCFGDGGAIATNDADIAARARALRQYGWETRDLSLAPGFNSRLDEIQAAILRVQLRHLDEGNERRRSIATHYRAACGRHLVAAQKALPGHVYHQFVVRHADRPALQQHFEMRGIGTAIHYPVPIHHQPGYQGRVSEPASGLAITEQASREVLSLPIFPQMSAVQVQRIVTAIEEWERGAR